MLKISNLSVSVENKLIINNLDLEIAEGKKVAVMGPNGSGKSTLSNVISGKPGYNIKEGSIKFEDTDILKNIRLATTPPGVSASTMRRALPS